MKKKYILFLVLLLTISCGHREIEGREFWVYEDYFTGNNCNIYKMIFDSGYYYIFKIDMSGPCDSTFEEDFIAEYTRFYSSNGTISARKGKIIIDYYNHRYSNNWNKKKLADTLVSITQKYSIHNVVYLPNDKESFEDRIILEVGGSGSVP